MKTLISYASEDYFPSQRSLAKSAANYFDNIISYNYSMLPDDFKNENKNILSQRRGMGYWLWKPKILLMTLDKVNDGDFVFYSDSGSMIINDISILFDLCIKNGDILLFDNRDGNRSGNATKNTVSIKRDTFILMGCDTEEYHNASHVDAAYQLYRKSQRTIDFIQEYLFYCKDSRIVTDSPNQLGQNFPNYHDHRHDQSVLSLLAKKWNINLEVEPSEWGNNVGDRKYPQLFWHHRIKSYTV